MICKVNSYICLISKELECVIYLSLCRGSNVVMVIRFPPSSMIYGPWEMVLNWWGNWANYFGLRWQIVIIKQHWSWPLFTKRTDVLSKDIVKSQSRDIGYSNSLIALKFEIRLGNAANLRAIEKVLTRISWLRDIRRSCSTTSAHLVIKSQVTRSCSIGYIALMQINT